MTDPLTLPKSLASYGTASFADTLAHELLDNLWKLPLEKLCQKGGWPYKDGPFSLYNIDTVDDDDCHPNSEVKNPLQNENAHTRIGGALRISCGISFEESIPSCCAGAGATDNHMGTLILTIDKSTALATATVTAI